jgi:hypothetical protein
MAVFIGETIGNYTGTVLIAGVILIAFAPTVFWTQVPLVSSLVF